MGSLISLVAASVPILAVYAIGLVAVIVALVLFGIMFLRIIGTNTQNLPLLAFLIGSPFFFKNFMYSIGYFDILRLHCRPDRAHRTGRRLLSTGACAGLCRAGAAASGAISALLPRYLPRRRDPLLLPLRLLRHARPIRGTTLSYCAGGLHCERKVWHRS